MDAKQYYIHLAGLFDAIIVSNKESVQYSLNEGIDIAAQSIMERIKPDFQLMFIGNGASAAISSHMATDFFKNGGIKAMAFNDSSLLTCISNDYGYQHVFEKPIEMFANRNDFLVAISSSGKSPNILEGVHAARSKGCYVLTLSGFKRDNPLRSTGDLNFYVPSDSYGPVEIIHHSICHCLLDLIIGQRQEQEEKESTSLTEVITRVVKERV